MQASLAKSLYGYFGTVLEASPKVYCRKVTLAQLFLGLKKLVEIVLVHPRFQLLLPPLELFLIFTKKFQRLCVLA